MKKIVKNHLGRKILIKKLFQNMKDLMTLIIMKILFMMILIDAPEDILKEK
jgi:hypothetical protein